MISQICNVKQQKSIEEQISEMLRNQKDIYFFGGLGGISLGVLS